MRLWNIESRAWNPESIVWYPESGINFGGTRELESGIHDSGFRSWIPLHREINVNSNAFSPQRRQVSSRALSNPRQAGLRSKFQTVLVS